MKIIKGEKLFNDNNNSVQWHILLVLPYNTRYFNHNTTQQYDGNRR